MARARREKREQGAVAWAYDVHRLRGGAALPPLPVDVRMVRASPGTRPVDSDNLHGYLKAVRDGIAKLYGVDDADGMANPPIRWSCAQERGPVHRVRVEVVARTTEAI